MRGRARGYCSRSVCVCVCGVIEEKGRENGRERRGHNTKTRGWEAFVDLTPCGCSVVKSSYMYSSDSVLVSIKTSSLTLTPQEQDTGCHGLENRGWWVKHL